MLFRSILSTGFYIAGNDNIVYLEDLPTSTTTKTGVLRMFYYNGDVKTYIKNMGTIDYAAGKITMPELNITGIDLTQSSIFELIIKPQSNDVASVRNQIVTIPSDNITVNMIIDKVSIGDPGGGKNYVFTSSRN